MPARRHPLGAPAPMHGVRPHRLLLQLPDEARHRALSRDGTPDHPVVRARRRLAVLLRRRLRVRDRSARRQPVTPLSSPADAPPTLSAPAPVRTPVQPVPPAVAAAVPFLLRRVA